MLRLKFYLVDLRGNARYHVALARLDTLIGEVFMYNVSLILRSVKEITSMVKLKFQEANINFRIKL